MAKAEEMMACFVASIIGEIGGLTKRVKSLSVLLKFVIHVKIAAVLSKEACMVSVMPGYNLFREAIMKVLRDQGLKFIEERGHVSILDEGDTKVHTCKAFFKSRHVKVTRRVAVINAKSCCIVVHRRDDLDFVKKLAANISSASGKTISYDFQETSEGYAPYVGCENDWNCAGNYNYYDQAVRISSLS